MDMPVILVVDDEDLMRRLLARMLSGIGVIYAVDSAARALHFMHGEPVDVVLSDQVMPGMLGDQLLAEISRRWPHTERILMSGHCDVAAVNQGLDSGEICYFFRKPLETKELLREVGERAQRAYLHRLGSETATRQGAALQDL